MPGMAEAFSSYLENNSKQSALQNFYLLITFMITTSLLVSDRAGARHTLKLRSDQIAQSKYQWLHSQRLKEVYTLLKKALATHFDYLPAV